MTRRIFSIIPIGIIALATGAPAIAGQAPAPAPRVRTVPAPEPPTPPEPPARGEQVIRVPVSTADMMYERARRSIEQGQFDRAIEQMSGIIERFGKLPVAEAAANRVDAAMYWKAYSEAKQRAVTEAMATVDALQKGFADSRWVRDAMALRVELQQAAGQPASPDAQPDEDLKLLALRGLMQSDPDRAVPMIEQVLSGNSSVKVKENALFVLSQSRSARAHSVLANVAKGASNPDLQLRAIRYLGTMSGAENAQILEDAYRSAADDRVKRAIIRSFMMKGDRTRLTSIANDAGSSVAVRGEAVQMLGHLKASDELTRFYARESSPELKRKAIQGLFVAGNAGALVSLARAEKDIALKKEIVQKLSVMKSSEATDYLVELLK